MYALLKTLLGSYQLTNMLQSMQGDGKVWAGLSHIWSCAFGMIVYYSIQLGGAESYGPVGIANNMTQDLGNKT